MYVFTLTYLSVIHMYVCVHTDMCACRVPFNTNTLAERAAAAASSLTALLMGCLLRLSNFFFSPFYTHTNRFSFLIVLICFPYVDLYIARLFITISWCLLFPNMRWASETHTNTHAYILSHIHTYIQTTLWKLGGGETNEKPLQFTALHL